MTASVDIPAIRLTHPVLGEEEIAAATAVLRSGHVVQGPQVAAFENEFSALVAGRSCVAVNSGTSALHLTLMAMGIGHGDEVVLPSFSFAATAAAVYLAGATPVFADIDPTTLCLDPHSAATAITARTAALLPVHLYGHPAAADHLSALAARHGLAMIEDACQAHAAALYGRPVGTWGDAGCFSFYPSKNMHAIEGGMITTSDPVLASKLRLLRNQGMQQRYAHQLVGTNARMTDVSAAIGRVQLRRLPAWTEQRRRNAATLDRGLADSGLGVPRQAAGASPVYHQYTVRVPGGPAARGFLQQRLAVSGIQTQVYYPTPIHRLPPYAAAAPSSGWRLPRTDQASEQVLSLPVHPGLAPVDLRHIVQTINATEIR